jgi:hypothetical protein
MGHPIRHSAGAYDMVTHRRQYRERIFHFTVDSRSRLELRHRAPTPRPAPGCRACRPHERVQVFGHDDLCLSRKHSFDQDLVELVVRVGAGVAEYVESESSSAASRTIDNVSAWEEVSSARFAPRFQRRVAEGRRAPGWREPPVTWTQPSSGGRPSRLSRTTSSTQVGQTADDVLVDPYVVRRPIRPSRQSC